MMMMNKVLMMRMNILMMMIEVVAYMHIWRICTLGLCLKMVLSVLMTAPDNSYNGHTGQFFSYKWNVRFTEEPTLLGSSSGDCNP